MKYRVVGWTDPTDEYVEYEEPSEGATNAIIDDIRANGYLFTGMDHQGCANCVPVLNDGKMRIYSDREFGDLMAEAHNGGSYLEFAFGFYDELEGGNTPPDKKHFYIENFIPEDISENFELEVSARELKRARTEKEIRIDDDEALRYIDKGDYVSIKCGEVSEKYKVLSAYRRKDLSEEELSRFFIRGDSTLRDKFINAKTLIIIELE